MAHSAPIAIVEPKPTDSDALPALLGTAAESQSVEGTQQAESLKVGKVSTDAPVITDEEEDRGRLAEQDIASADVPMSWPMVVGCVLGVCACLYVFLIGLSLMGSSFEVLGGKGASGMFSAVDNPIVGLMTGVLSTVLVQSSSTSTSIVVAMVGADQLTVRNGIPIIMGANIGTSVTNTIVSMGQSGNRIDLERAFAGATVHDMFNMLTVLTLLPTESIIAVIQGEGGPLYWLTDFMTSHLVSRSKGEEMFKSPISQLTAPLVKSILAVNKYIIYALSIDKPDVRTPSAVNSTICALVDCSSYSCVNKDLDHVFKGISNTDYAKLTKCGNALLGGNGKPCGEDQCYLDAGIFYTNNVEGGRLIKGGLLEGLGDVVGGVIGLVISLVMLGGGLVGLCKMLQKVFLGKAKAIIRYSTRLNDYLAILIGMAITIVVQSSSVITAALTPLCGLGVLPLAKMLPLTLGANVGTTCTALLASLVSLKFGAVQIALCHCFFNIFGIMIWFVIPAMRRVPLGAAKLLGLYASYYRFVPALYILVAFVLVPCVILGISIELSLNVAVGSILLGLALSAFGIFEFWWLIGFPVGQPGYLRALSKENRLRGEEELNAANASIGMGTNGAVRATVV